MTAEPIRRTVRICYQLGHSNKESRQATTSHHPLGWSGLGLNDDMANTLTLTATYLFLFSPVASLVLKVPSALSYCIRSDKKDNNKNKNNNKQSDQRNQSSLARSPHLPLVRLSRQCSPCRDLGGSRHWQRPRFASG